MNKCIRKRKEGKIISERKKVRKGRKKKHVYEIDTTLVFDAFPL